jgi:predicted dehydrogenase
MLVGEIAGVRALRAVPTSPSDPPLDVEFAFECGARGIALGHAGAGLSFFEMDIVCERGRVQLSRGAEQIDVFELAPSPVYATFFAHSLTGSHAGGLGAAMRAAIDDVAACVSDGGIPACSGRDALQALRVVEAARQSGGTWTSIGAAA